MTQRDRDPQQLRPTRLASDAQPDQSDACAYAGWCKLPELPLGGRETRDATTRYLAVHVGGVSVRSARVADLRDPEDPAPRRDVLLPVVVARGSPALSRA